MAYTSKYAVDSLGKHGRAGKKAVRAKREKERITVKAKIKAKAKASVGGQIPKAR